MTKKEYIEKAVSGIRSKTERREVEEELSVHLDELTELWRNRGLDESDAEEKAVEEMGAPEKTAKELGKVHTSGRASSIAAASALLLIWVCFAVLSWMHLNVFVSSSVNFSSLLNELFFAVAGGITLRYGIKHKNVLLCTAVLIDVFIYIVMGFWLYVYNYSSGSLPVSPAVMFGISVFNGTWSELAKLTNNYSLDVADYAVAVSMIFHILWISGTVAVTVAVARERLRLNRKKTVTIKNIAALGIAVTFVFVLLADIPPVVATVRNMAASEELYYDGWYLVQYDKLPDGTDALPQSLSELPDDTEHIRILRYADETDFSITDDDYVEKIESERYLYTEESIPGFVDPCCNIVTWEMNMKKPYLAAIPEKDKNLLPERAEFYNLTVSSVSIRLKTAESIVEEYWFVDIKNDR